jgi:CRISPR/Cas system CMR-associated protein Cmr1 (group 7 of RAMP superfamily)
MNAETFCFELITPCFCSGAEPDRRAEIRAASIRGQLRWWLRTLGGFKSLADQHMSLREQEDLVFGSTAGDAGRAGRLLVRVTSLATESSRRSGQELGADNIGSPAGYFLFPLRSQKDKQNGQGIPRYRGVFLVPLPKFTAILQWRCGNSPWACAPALKDDIMALGSVFGHLGALGFRSRRGFGAMRLTEPQIGVSWALDRFADRNGIVVKTLGEYQALRPVQEAYWKWMTLMRTHGSTSHGSLNSGSPNWSMIRNDHERGLDVGRRSGVPADTVFRSALGLPIIQQFSQPSRREVDWYPKFDPAKLRSKKGYQGEGRFASPVLLRPHRDAQGKWHALVIFVDAHRWRADRKVYLNGQERSVSLGLYEAMKSDKRLKDFPA